MKNRFLFSILFLFLITNTSISQIRFHHRLTQNRITQWGYHIENVGGTSFSICEMLKGVITVSGTGINLDFWQVPTTVCPSESINPILNSTNNTQLRLVYPRATFGTTTLVLWMPFQAINLGLNTLPFRYRFPVKLGGVTYPGVGASSFSLALNGGYTFGYSAITPRAINNYSATIGLYAGPSTIDLKKSSYKDQAKYIADQTNATFSYGANLILARNTLGLVFAFGFENAIGENATQWIYHGRPYLAFGVNTSFGK